MILLPTVAVTTLTVMGDGGYGVAKVLATGTAVDGFVGDRMAMVVVTVEMVVTLTIMVTMVVPVTMEVMVMVTAS